MRINNIPTKTKGWSTSEITLTGRDDSSIKKVTSIMIAHNIPLVGSVNSIDAAVQNWFIRANKFTDKALVEYINSKSSYSGHEALTIKEFNEKYPEPEVKS